MKKLTDRYLEVFPAQIVEATMAGSTWRHAWVEITPTAVDGYAVEPGARSGTTDLNYLLELNNRPIDPGTLVWVRYRDGVGGVNHFEAEIGTGTGGSGDTFIYNNVTTTYYNSTFYYYNVTTTVPPGYVWLVSGPGHELITAPLTICGYLFWCYRTCTVGVASLDNWAFPSANSGIVYRMVSESSFFLTGIIPASTTYERQTDPSDVLAVDWANPTNVFASDNAWTTYALPRNSVSQDLVVMGFNLNVPASAVILGITVSVERNKQGAGVVIDSEVQLLRAAVADGDTISNALDWPVDVDAVIQYGDNANLWGTTWTPDDVNHPEFGVIFHAMEDDVAAVTLRVDNIKVAVNYRMTDGGQVIAIANAGPDLMTLAHDDDASMAENRFLLENGTDKTVGPDGIVLCWYDPADHRWRVFREGDGGGAAAALTVEALDGDPTVPDCTILRFDEAAGFVLTSPAAGETNVSFAAAGGGVGVFSERSFYQPFRWYYGGHPPDVLTSSYGTLSSGLVYAFPFLSGPGAVVDSIGCLIGATVGSGASLNLGIYDNLAPGDYRPHTRLYDSGPLSTATSTQIKAGPGLGITLDPDTIYWLVIQASSSSIQPRSASCNDMWPILGSAPASVGGAQGIGWSAASSGGGALASTWPTSTSVYAPNNTTGAYMIGLSFSSVNGPSSGGGGGGGPIDGTTATTLVGILQGNGSVVGTVTVGSGLTYSGGTLSATGGGSYTDEQAQDAVANALTNSSRIQWTYNDTLNQISADVFNYSITDQQIRYAAGTSVIGRAAGGASGPVADIAATADGQVLTRVSGALTWAVPATGGTGTVTSVAATAPAAGLTITGSPITTSGTLTFALADDLAALEALSGTNTIYYRSATSTWSAVTVGANLTFSGGTLSVAITGGTSTFATLGLLENQVGPDALQIYLDESITSPRYLKLRTGNVDRLLTLTGDAQLRGINTGDDVPFIAAGTSHAAGNVPDPGATAHTPPYVLCDDVTWRRVPGTLLGTSDVRTQETLGGTVGAWNDCPTVQTVSFTLTAATDLLIVATAMSLNNTAAAQNFIGYSLDGGAEATLSFTYITAVNSWLPLSGSLRLAAVASGSHTVKLRFLTFVGAAQYQYRCLNVFAAS